MTHLLRHRVAVLVIAGVLSAGTAFAQDTIAGHWTLEVDSPQGLMKVGLMLNVEGEALKGTIASEMGESAFTGTVKDGAIAFTPMGSGVRASRCRIATARDTAGTGRTRRTGVASTADEAAVPARRRPAVAGFGRGMAGMASDR
jgi:hypothetical protein